MMRWYASKVDGWLAAVLVLPPIASTAVTFLAWQRGDPTEVVIGLLSLLLVTGIYVGLLFPIRYGIDRHELIVRAGMIKYGIPVGSIVEVVPTRNPLSSPALSLDRLSARYGAGMFKRVLISPTPREAFLEDLAGVASLESEGDRWVRR